MPLKLHSPAPNFSLPSTEGETVTLSEVMKNGHHVLLVFLRHLG